MLLKKTQHMSKVIVHNYKQTSVMNMCGYLLIKLMNQVVNVTKLILFKNILCLSKNCFCFKFNKMYLIYNQNKNFKAANMFKAININEICVTQLSMYY